MQPDEVDMLLRAVVAHVRSTPAKSKATASVIPCSSDIQTSLQHLGTTAYVHESEFRFIRPGDRPRLLATTSLLNCIALFVHSPDGTGFCAHLSPCSLQCSIQEAVCMRKDGLVFRDMATRLREVFQGTENAALSVSLVGGWKVADNYHPKLRAGHYPSNDELWTFSSVVREFVMHT